VIKSAAVKPDPKLDLVLERVIDVPPDLVWTAWTKPEHVKKWFVPAPWTITHCEIDLRPGGIFSTTMRSPEGQEFPNLGCYIEVVLAKNSSGPTPCCRDSDRRRNRSSPPS